MLPERGLQAHPLLVVRTSRLHYTGPTLPTGLVNSSASERTPPLLAGNVYAPKKIELIDVP